MDSKAQVVRLQYSIRRSFPGAVDKIGLPEAMSSGSLVGKSNDSDGISPP